MSYKASQTDKSNAKWFENDKSRRSLKSISLQKGAVRGLTEFSLEFQYPITAISGSNGSGKSTILALAACAFHNEKSGFIPPLRNKSYYTFHDFFVQSSSEAPVEGVEIEYGILHNNKGRKGPGLSFQIRKKKKGGKWNDYALRLKRNVVYFGVQRVVPHYERSTHKSYRSKFKPGTMPPGDRSQIAAIAAKVIGKPYNDFDAYEHTKYTLPVASANGISYSGFNMGAGEGSVFEILAAVFGAGEGALLVIDEIELGLHEQAQVRLISELKELCKSRKCQIICSTHSHAILRSLPPEGRFHVERLSGKTFITPGASPDFACGKMGRPDAYELDVFTEDHVAVEILQAALPADIRSRVNIKSIGSHAAVVRQLASRKLEGVNNCLCVLDGDQRNSKANAIGIAQAACEASTKEERGVVSDWVSERLFYLPGSDWPEKWIIKSAQELVKDDTQSDPQALLATWGISNLEELSNCLREGEAAEKHSEFYDLAVSLSLSEQKTRSDLIAFVVNLRSPEFSELINGIRQRLP